MHERFEATGVRTPRTHLVRRLEDLDDIDLESPLRVKDPGSYRPYGVERVTDRRTLERAVSALLDAGREAVIVQEFADIRAEARITVAAGRVAHTLLRRNPLDECYLTLARFGSVYVYDDVPETWDERFVSYAERLGLRRARSTRVGEATT